VLQPNEQN
jgi:hypothetical protein